MPKNRKRQGSWTDQNRCVELESDYDFTDAIKDAAPVIGGTIGFGLGGPMGAAIGSGIGGLVAGQDVEDALKTAAIGGALGYGASKMGATPFLRGTPGTAVTAAPTASGTASQVYPASTA